MIRSRRRPRRAVERARRVLGRHGAWLWPGAVLLLASWFALRERSQLATLGGVLRDAEPTWVAGVVAIELAVLGLTAAVYRSLLRRLGHRVAWPSLVRLHLRRVLVGTVTPVGGPPSLWVLVHHLRRWGVPTDDALLVAAMRSAVGYAAFLLLLVPAMVLHGASGRVLLGAGLAAAAFAAGAAGLLALLNGNGACRRLARWLPGRARSFVEHVGSHGIRAGDLRRPFGLAVAIRLSGATMLYACLRAVGEEPPFSVALAAYAVGLLILSLAPIFQGIGVVELATAAALERMGVPGAVALGAALLCRLGELWLPLALGAALQASALGRGEGPPAPVSGRVHGERPPRPRLSGTVPVPPGARAGVAD